MSISPVELKKRLRTQAIDRFYSNNEHICYQSSSSLALSFFSLSLSFFSFSHPFAMQLATTYVNERREEKRKKNAYIDRDSRIVELGDRSTRKFSCCVEEKGNERMITAYARFLVTAGAIMKMNCYSHCPCLDISLLLLLLWN